MASPGRPTKAPSKPPRTRIRELREARAWSQRQLAERIGKSTSQVSRAERDELKGVNLELLYQCARVFDVHVNELLAGERVLGADERELLAIYRHIRPDARPRVLNMIRELERFAA